MSEQKEIYQRHEIWELLNKGIVHSYKEYKLLQVGKVYEMWCNDALEDYFKRSVIKIIAPKKCSICYFKYARIWPERYKGNIIEDPTPRMVAFREIDNQLNLF